MIKLKKITKNFEYYFFLYIYLQVEVNELLLLGNLKKREQYTTCM